MFEESPLQRCKVLNIKLGVEYFFLILYSDAKFCELLLEGLGTSKILAHGIKKQNSEFLTDFHIITQIESLTFIPTQKFHQ